VLVDYDGAKARKLLRSAEGDAGISVEKYADANESHARPCDSDPADELVRGAAVLSLRGRRLALKLTQLLVPNSLK